MKATCGESRRDVEQSNTALRLPLRPEMQSKKTKLLLSQKDFSKSAKQGNTA
jgi:hypothetical protein